MTVTTWVEGADYSYSHPDPHGYHAAGKLFALRYFSRTAGKGLSTAERDGLWAAGVVLGGLYETTANRALDGHAAGLVDGRAARAMARTLDYPDSLPVFYAVDFNATAAQLAGPVGDYLRAVTSVDPHAGVYGGLPTIAYAFDHNVMAYGFQTYAWSGGVWDVRAQVQQYHNGVMVAGGDVDLCRAHDDYPFWPDPGTGDIGAPMTLTDADAATVWDHQIPNFAYAPAGSPATIKALTAMITAGNQAHAAHDQSGLNAAAIDALAAKVDAQAATLAQILAAVTGVEPAPGDGVTGAELAAGYRAAADVLDPPPTA